MKVFQSVDERAPVVVEFAVRIPNTPVRLLYVRGHTAERAVSPILVATVDERVASDPEREDTFELVVVRLVFVVARLPESEAIFAVWVAIVDSAVVTRPERVAILAFVVVLFVTTVPERVDTLEFVVARLVVRVARLPVAVARLVLVVARLLFVVAILPVIAAIVPESAFCARVFVK